MAQASGLVGSATSTRCLVTTPDDDHMGSADPRALVPQPARPGTPRGSMLEPFARWPCAPRAAWAAKGWTT